MSDVSLSSMNIPHDFHSHDLIVRLSIIQREFEPRPATIAGALCLWIAAPSLISRIRRDDQPTERVGEFPSLDRCGSEVSYIGVAELTRL